MNIKYDVYYKKEHYDSINITHVVITEDDIKAFIQKEFMNDDCEVESITFDKLENV